MAIFKKIYSSRLKLPKNLGGGEAVEHIARGKTVEEALQSALKEKGWSREEVNYQIIDPGKQGFLIKREAVVKVIKKRSPQKEDEGSLAALVTMEEGRLQFAPELFQRQVMIYPPQKVVVCINEQPLKERTLLVPEDEVYVYGRKFDVLDEWIRLDVSRDGLEASIQLLEQAAYDIAWRIRETKERYDIYFQETLRQQLPITVDQVMDWLKEKGIVYGLDRQAVETWLEKDFRNLKPVIVAKGKAKVDGTPTQFVELYIKQNESKTDNDGEPVDWFGIKHVESVTAGEEILEVVPPTKGTDGMDVYGKVIPAQPGQEIALKLGKGVAWNDEGKRIVATSDGRPRLAKGMISIEPVFELKSDLTLETGSIHFNGDVLISGDVHEGLSIEATGDVEVRGTVTQAKIMAGKNIKIGKNVISSQITAGGHASVYVQLKHKLEKVLNHLNVLIAGYKQLQGMPAFKTAGQDRSPGKLIKLLLQSKVHHFEDDLNVLEEEFRQGELTDKRMSQWLSQVRNKLTGLGPFSVKSMDEIKELAEKGQEMMEEWDQFDEVESHVEAGYIHNSTVRANNNIYVRGSGVYNSRLYAGESIFVEGRPGVVRGGYLEAKDLIKVRELGVESGVKGQVKLREAKGKIIADHLYPGITFKINGVQHEQQTHAKYVQVYYDEESHSIRLTGNL